MVRDGGGGRARGQKKSPVHEALCFPKLVIFPGNNDVQVIMQVHSNMYCIILKPISWWINFHTHEIKVMCVGEFGCSMCIVLLLVTNIKTTKISSRKLFRAFVKYYILQKLLCI